VSGSVRLGVGTKFFYDGETITVIEMSPTCRGNEVLVENHAGTRRFRLAVRELLASGRATILTDEVGPRSDDEIEVAGVVLTDLDSAARAQVAERAANVREVLTGYKSGSPDIALPDEPRLAYAPHLPQTVRYKNKASELGVSCRTVFRWVRAYREHGEAGLAHIHRSEATGRTDPRWLSTAIEIMVENARLSRPSQTNVIGQIQARLSIRYGADVVPMPSQATMYRRLEALDRQIPTFHGSRQRNRDVADRPSREYGKLRPTRPGEYLVMDSNRLDVFALDPVTLRWVRVELTVSMDWYSRCITALRLTPLSTKSIDIAGLLFRTFRPLPAPDYWPAHAVWPEHGTPCVVFPEVEALNGNKTGLTHPAVVPETLVIDHGKAFTAQHINSVCQRMGISVQPARLRTGRDKGVVERFFLTLRQGLLQTLPSYTGPDLYSRGLSPEADAFFYLDELEELIRQWVAAVYHHTPNESLADPKVPGRLMSPAEMFQHGVERAGYIEAPSDPDLAFEFLKPVKRQILHYGVQHQLRKYNGPALNQYHDKDSPYGQDPKRRWYVHVNPDDITRVFFRDPFARTWHTLLWEHAEALRMPMSEDAVAYARHLAAASGAPTDPELACAALFERWNIRQGDSVVERRIALRLSRERAELLGDLSTADAPDALAFLQAHRDALSAPDRPGALKAANGTDGAVDDDLDEFDDSDAEENDEDYYADAFEDDQGS
jgi:transposase InsO family protein